MSRPTTTPTTVMVADDDGPYRSMLRAVIAHQPGLCWVAEANDGQQAIDVAAAARPDVLVLDQEMPRLRGIEALALIRRGSPRTRIILHSGSPDPGLPAQAYAAGADLVIPKGTPLERLLAALAQPPGRSVL